MNKKIYEYKRIADIKRVEFIYKTLQTNIPANGRVLDVGCGNGVISRFIGQQGYNVTGIDISEETIQQARSLTSLPNIQFSVQDAEQLVADNQTFDAIICSEVLEHLHQPQNLVNTLYKLLKSDGCLIVTVPNGNGPRETFVTKPVQKLQKDQGSLFSKFVFKIKSMLGYRGTTVQSSASDLTHIQFFTIAQLKELAKKSTFKIIKFGKSNFVEDVFPFSLLTKRIPALQKLDCKIADMLPASFSGGFLTVWKKL